MIPHIWKALLSLLWFKWQHVGVIDYGTETIYYKADRYKIYVHCFESNWGYRKIKVAAFYGDGSRECKQPKKHINPLFFRKFRSTKMYQTEIYPWLCGRNSKEIPSYKKIKSGKWDFVRNLKDKANIILNKSEENA